MNVITQSIIGRAESHRIDKLLTTLAHQLLMYLIHLSIRELIVHGYYLYIDIRIKVVTDNHLVEFSI